MPPSIDAASERGILKLNRSLAGALLLAAALAAAVPAARAQAVSPPVVSTQAAAEIAGILQQGAADQAREQAAYGGLNDRGILATKQRQLQARIGRDLAAIVAREAVQDRQRALETAAYIARQSPAHAEEAYRAAEQYSAAPPAILPPNWFAPVPPPPPSRPMQPTAYTPGPTTLPGNWYDPPVPPPAASRPIQPTQYSAGPTAGRPGNWYDSPVLARYGYGAAAAPAPAYVQPAAFTPAATGLASASMTGASMAGASMAGASMAGASMAGSSHGGDIWDPVEPVNRAFFAFNEVVDTFLLRPIAWLYSFTPTPIKTGFRNAFANLKSPAVLLNHGLQGNLGDAATTVGRFAVNSTVGVLGFWDAADNLFDWKGKPADFGQTLHSYGIGDGPFLVLPLLGPTNLRDGVGQGVDALADPLNYILNDNARLALAGGNALVRREALLVPLDELRKDSVDYYASLRSASQQQRRAFLQSGDPAAAAAARQAADDLFNEAR